MIDIFSNSSYFMIEENYLNKLSTITSIDDKMLETIAPKRSDRFQNQFSGIREDVAIIDIYGVIFRYDNPLTSFGYGTSLESIIKDINIALKSPDIQSIILRIDSPGGEVAGVSDLADFIYENRNKKKITAYAESMIASASYFIGSASNEVIVGEMAMVGSIGVVTTILKNSNTNIVEFVSSNATNKRLDIETEIGRERLQQRVDLLSNIMVDKIAKYRGLSRDELVSAGDNGGVRIGREAVKNKLADKVLKFEELFMNIKNNGGIKIMLTPDVKAEDTATSTTAQSTEQIKQEAIQKERERILALDDLTITGAESIIAEAKANGTTPEATAVKIVQFMKEQGKTSAKPLSANATQTLNVAPLDIPKATDGETATAKAEAAAKMFNRSK